MKILAIGDFHGEFPSKLQRRLRKESFDVIVSQGDFCGNKEIVRLFFRYHRWREQDLLDFVGKMRINELERKNYSSGVKILKILKKFNKPIIATTGNWDPSNLGEVGFPKEKNPFAKDFRNMVKRLKIIIADFRRFEYSGLNFVGYPRSTYPGMVTGEIEKRFSKKYDEHQEIFRRIKIDNERYFKLFKKKVDRNTIFVSHNSPYKSKLDIIESGPRKGFHYGSFLARRVIVELKPRLAICGHIHEGHGIQRIGDTLAVNTGSAKEGRAALIDYSETSIGVELIKV